MINMEEMEEIEEIEETNELEKTKETTKDGGRTTEGGKGRTIGEGEETRGKGGRAEEDATRGKKQESVSSVGRQDT